MADKSNQADAREVPHPENRDAAKLRGPGDHGAVPKIEEQLRGSRGQLTIKEGEQE
ncbi:hypothetical protein F2Q70_00029967 [Brassica cretica]|uniref:Uncharacterized protein n=2 Tax=Brassica cretica TaxID=69181 RepID=A0A3N6Q9S8_BRACR|nr:hypothetical protein F2Q70_00029967 [Brassica cretica]KAF2550229.1 hypothetical protein F2Q68_00034445 [Brassica cretica]KAF3489809.1 hypothetical protein F2Q69_00053233 [Brassica cretica]KAF3597204.1 hypothetical protein DY000_02022255 [Brassica cretica]